MNAMTSQANLTEPVPAVAVVSPSPVAHGAESPDEQPPLLSIGTPAPGAHRHDTSRLSLNSTRLSIEVIHSNASFQLIPGGNPALHNSPKRRKVYQYVERTWDMLAECKSAHIISWQSDGRSFKVHNRNDFGCQILSRYFRTKEYKSFRRNLKNYGFTCTESRNGVIFSHEFFHRDNRDLCRYIKNKRSNPPIKVKDNKPKATVESKNLRAVAKPFAEFAPDESRTNREGAFRVAPVTSTTAPTTAPTTLARSDETSSRNRTRDTQAVTRNKRKSRGLDNEPKSRKMRRITVDCPGDDIMFASLFNLDKPWRWVQDYFDPEAIVKDSLKHEDGDQSAEMASPEECKEMYEYFQTT